MRTSRQMTWCSCPICRRSVGRPRFHQVRSRDRRSIAPAPPERSRTTNNWSCSEMLLSLRAATASDTRAIGEAIADSLRARDAVLLTGELGAGKTTFVQGLVRGLGIEDPVASPTFTLVR